jgi:hypothetical protein
MRRTLVVLSVFAMAFGPCGHQERKSVVPNLPPAQCRAAVIQGAPSEVRLFVLGVGFPSASTDFDVIDTARACGAFTLFQSDASSSGKASLATEILRLPAGTSLPDLSIDTTKPCPFQYSTATLSDVATKAGTFKATHYAVVVGPDIIQQASVDVGCRSATTFFVPSQIGSGTIVHELGHTIAGLYDEYGGNDPYTGNPFTDRNCSTDKKAFRSITGIDGMEPCTNLFRTGIYRPTNSCRMQTASAGPFCKVCAGIIKDTLQAPELLRRTPPSPASKAAWEAAHRAEKGLEVVATVDTARTLHVISVVEATPDTILPQVITGEWFVVAFNGERDVVAVAPLSLQGGELPPGRVIPIDERTPESLFQPSAYLLRFTLVGLDSKSVFGKNLDLRLVRVEHARRDLFVTNEVVEELRKPQFTKKVFGLQQPLEDYLRRR